MTFSAWIYWPFSPTMVREARTTAAAQVVRGLLSGKLEPITSIDADIGQVQNAFLSPVDVADALLDKEYQQAPFWIEYEILEPRLVVAASQAEFLIRSCSTASQYSRGMSSAGPGVGLTGVAGRSGCDASFSICFSVGMRQLAGLSLMPRIRTQREQKSSPRSWLFLARSQFQTHLVANAREVITAWRMTASALVSGKWRRRWTRAILCRRIGHRLRAIRAEPE